MSWSHERICKPRNKRFNAHKIRSEARQEARLYALQTKGAAHQIKVTNLLKIKQARQDKRTWQDRVERGLRLQDREITARRWLLRRGAMTGSDFSPAERTELRRWFDVLDTDGGGDIDLAELAAPLLSTGIASSIPQVRAIIQKNEIEEGGGIDFESFQRLLKRGTQTNKNGEATQDDGLVALQKLRTHVEAAQSNLGLNLDSRINATRRKILLNELKGIRNSNSSTNSDNNNNNNNNNNNDGKASSRKSPRSLHQKINEDDVLEEKRLQKLQRRRKQAAKAQRKEDKMLALWRVILGSKNSDTAGFHLGDLPAVEMDRQRVYDEWKTVHQNANADSGVVRHEWQQVNHWMKRSRDHTLPPSPIIKRAMQSSGQQQRLNKSQSAPILGENETDGEEGEGEGEVTQLERMLSSYLRPTRADIFRLRKLKERKRLGKANLETPTMLKSKKARDFPPYSVTTSSSVTTISEINLGRRRQRGGVIS